jgi:hypothetical protein
MSRKIPCVLVRLDDVPDAQAININGLLCPAARVRIRVSLRKRPRRHLPDQLTQSIRILRHRGRDGRVLGQREGGVDGIRALAETRAVDGLGGGDEDLGDAEETGGLDNVVGGLRVVRECRGGGDEEVAGVGGEVDDDVCGVSMLRMDFFFLIICEWMGSCAAKDLS